MTKPSYKRQCDVIEKCDKIKGNRNGVKWAIGLLIVALAIATITTVGLTIYISKQKSDGCHSPSSSRVRGRGGGEPPQSLQQQSNNADAGTNTEWFYGFYETKEIFDIPDYFQRTPFSRKNPKPIFNIRKKIKSADIGDKKPRVRATDVRLPRHLIPTVYDLNLQPNMYSGDPATFTFDGYVKIYLDTREVGSNVTLHTNKITINEDTIRFGKEDGSPGGPNYSGERSHDDERQFEIFSLDGELVVGERYYIEMNFTGPLTGDLAGLYLSQYQRGADTVYIATTHMEPTEARKAFPCFDEPQMKAVFNVKLVRKKHLKSLSNMNIIGTETMTDEFEVDIYNTSEKMSTYLIAFVVCGFEYTETVTRKGVQYRAWSRPEYINQTSVSLRTGSEVIDYFADYFGIGYPLPKEDMIAVPDFGAGAMENWGLITYRETAMLFEEGVSSESDLQRVNTVIAHELAHMWFGDLVTMEWWDDLWLNEGFASFVEYMGVDFLHPDWKMFEQFITDLYEVFEIDALVTSHPIYVPVENPDEISEIFDGISYSKGASIIRMMRFFLGENVFQEGVQIYLKNREFQNANHNDLWAGLEEAARKHSLSIDVPTIMDTWILQMNYPIVKVTKSSSGKIQLEQNRFLTDPDAVDPGKYPSPYNYTWKIPFTFTTKTDSNFNQTANDVIWLEGKDIEIPKEYPGIEEWIIGNIQQYGVYRVHYDDSNWLELIDQLKIDHKAIHAINRAQVMNDAFALAKAELLSMDIALQTVDYLQDEEEYIPWVAAGIELAYIDTMLSESSIYGLFEIPKEYPGIEEWIIGNIQQYGVYRVHYDDSNWLELIDQLKIDHKAIHAINRAQVMNDAFALAKAELLSMDIALQTVDYLQDEEEYIPWVAAGIELAYIDTMLSESSIYGLFEIQMRWHPDEMASGSTLFVKTLFQKFMRAKVEKQFERLGLNDTGSSHLTSYVRASIAGKACSYGNVQCVTEAKKLFEEYMTTQVNPISPGLKSTVYCTALRYGGEPEWEFAFDMYKTATVAAEKNRLLSALSCTTQPWLLYRMLDLTLQPDVIRKQDAYQVYIQVGGNKVGSLIAWNFFRGNWNQIFQTYGTGSFSLSNIIRGVTSTFNTDFLLQEMKAFQREHPNMGTGTRAFSQAIEAVETNIIWMSKNYESVKQWLERPVRV